jgi:AraC-like DNA-binding protein
MFLDTDQPASGAAFSTTDTFDFNQHNQLRKIGWLPQAIRLGPGDLGFCVHGVELADGVYVDQTWLSGAASLEATAHPDSLLVGFFSGEGFRLQGASLPTAHLCVVPPGARWDAASHRGGQWQAVHFSGAALRGALGDTAAAQIASLSEMAAGGTITAKLTGEAVALHDLLQAILRGAERAGVDRGRAEALAQVQHRARVVIREVLSGVAKPVARSGYRRAQVARAAARMIGEGVHAGGPDAMDLDDVARALGVSRRTVQLAFSEYFGVSFRTLYHAARLHRAHAMIRAQGHELSVTQIATRCGFAHLGRFSRYYHRMFGRLPRDTRSLAWGGRVAARASEA